VTSVRRWLDQIGGPNAISIWSWVITLPIALVVGNISTASRENNSDILVWTAVLFVVHVLLGAVMWVAFKAVLPNRPRRPRPFVALAVFVTLGLARSGLLEFLDPLFGPQGTPLVSRILTNIIGGTLVLALIAIVVDDYRTNSDMADQLRKTQASLQALAEQEAETLRAADLDEIAKVKIEVEEQLRQRISGPEHIRVVSETIVRTRSHYLAKTDVDALTVDVVDSRSAREIVRSVARGLGFPAPVVFAVIVELLVIGSVATTWNWAIALTNAVLAGTVIAVMLYLARRFMPLPSVAWLRVLVVSSVLMLVAVAVSWIASTFISATLGDFPPPYAAAAILVLIVGLGISTWESVTRDRKMQRQALMEAVAREAATIDRVHGDVARRRAAAAEFLHGPIQSQMGASALRGESNEEALAALELRFAEYGATTSTWDAREQVGELIEAWSGIMAINVECSSGTWDRLKREQLASRLLLDVLSESITNAVRHGTAGDVDISIGEETGADSNRLHVTVSSLGTLSGDIGNGTGLARLVDRGAQITLEELKDRVVLRAIL